MADYARAGGVAAMKIKMDGAVIGLLLGAAMFLFCGDAQTAAILAIIAVVHQSIVFTKGPHDE